MFSQPGGLWANGDVLVPGYDVDGKLWTIQYIKEDGTKRFAKDSRKHGCFHVVGAPNGAAALQKIAMSPVVVIVEGYATAATLAEHGKVPTLAAYDSGNLLSVATSIRERWPDKAIVIAGDDEMMITGPKPILAGKKHWRRPRPWPALPSSPTSAQNSAAED
jgi:phage/plasmid primase-like uncharacterized protein